MTNRNVRSLRTTWFTLAAVAAAGGLFAGCGSQASPEQEQNVQPLGSITLCLDVVAGICTLASDPAACELGLGGICPAVISVDVATCEAKFSSACESFGIGTSECNQAAAKACTNFSTPGVCYDDTFNACISLGGTDALCDSVATAICSNTTTISCDDIVDKLCVAIPLNAADCDAAHLALCPAGSPVPPAPTPVPPAPTPVPPAPGNPVPPTPGTPVPPPPLCNAVKC